MPSDTIHHLLLLSSSAAPSGVPGISVTPTRELDSIEGLKSGKERTNVLKRKRHIIERNYRQKINWIFD